MECSICSEEIQDWVGHNPQPVSNGKCCNKCNMTIVIPARIKEMSNDNARSTR